MCPITIALLFTTALGVSGLNCNVGSFTNINKAPTGTMKCPSITVFCYRKVVTAQGTTTYDYSCDSANDICGLNGGVDGNEGSLYCCNEDYCNTQLTIDVETTVPSYTTYPTTAEVPSTAPDALSTTRLPEDATKSNIVTTTNTIVSRGYIVTIVCSAMGVIKYVL